MLRFIFIILFSLGWVPWNSVAAELPDYLPRYKLDLKIDPSLANATGTIRMTWTNPSDQPTSELQVNFYPHYQVSGDEVFLLGKTLELLRMPRRVAMDRRGQAGQINDIRLIVNGQATQRLPYEYRQDNLTALRIPLPNPVAPNDSVTVEMDFEIQLPNKQGRWGYWNDIYYLTHSLPTLAYYDRAGWHAMPFVPWHQPFWNEAGHYETRITLPESQVLATSAGIARVEPAQPGWKTVTTKPFVGRDFAILCSDQYQVLEEPVRLKSGREIMVRCYFLTRHREFATEILTIAGEALQKFSDWFGDYPHDEFSIAESYFGWNGDESSSLIMIDERVFAMPKVGRGYVEYLVSHETCHQWWYNRIGTNGYYEPFVDEGAATFFTHRYLDEKRGKNNKIVAWPGNRSFTPTIRRENYRFAPLYGAIRSGTAPSAGESLESYGSISSLFSGAYDRGSKVYALVESRMGSAAFMDFVRDMMQKYYFRTISIALLKKELEQYTGKSWDDVFENWVYGTGLTDWSVEYLSVDRRRLPKVRQPRFSRIGESERYRVVAVVRQKGEINEPTTLALRYADGSLSTLRIPIRTQFQSQDDEDISITPLDDQTVRIELQTDRPPVDVLVDPDRVLLDRNPANNRWRADPNIRIVPLNSFASDNDLTNDYDRWNFTLGPWVWGPIYQDPWYTLSSMFGLRAAAYRTQTFKGGIYSTYRFDFQDIVLGADAVVDHWPFPKTQIGFNYERRIAGPLFDDDSPTGQNRANVFFRYVFQPTSSLYMHPSHYIEGFSSYSDNFLPMPRLSNPDAERLDFTWLSGLHYRLNLYTPYWDPETGVWVDLTYGAGPGRLRERQTVQQARAELAIVRRLERLPGYFGGVRVASRGVVQAAWPRQGEFFALGGGTLFRGFDLQERHGSLLWNVNTELRLPLFQDVEWNFFDNVAGVRNIHLATFYDVGAVYTNGDVVGNIAHALGAGVRVDLAFFSFIERATMRFDVAKTVNAASPFQFWFGIQHPF